LDKLFRDDDIKVSNPLHRSEIDDSSCQGPSNSGWVGSRMSVDGLGSLTLRRAAYNEGPAISS
jgi:hypothetical protein